MKMMSDLFREIKPGVIDGTRMACEDLPIDEEKLKGKEEIPLEMQTWNESQLDDCDEFICAKCHIHLEEWLSVDVDEDDGDKAYHEFRFNYCPNCGREVVVKPHELLLSLRSKDGRR